MRRPEEADSESELSALTGAVKELIGRQAYRECEGRIAAAMSSCPHAPQPHNLMGILLETMGNHSGAMRHFRAAWALDPAYLPARYNLDRYASFYPTGGGCAYDESDCPDPRLIVRQRDSGKTGAGPAGEKRV